MTITLDAIVAIAVNLVLVVAWAVRLEMKVRTLRENLAECKAVRDARINEGRTTEHEFRQKLDVLLQQVAKINGQLEHLLKNGGGVR